MHSIQVGLLPFERFKGSLVLKHPDITLDVTSIEKDLQKTSFSIPAKCLSRLNTKCRSAGRETLGIHMLVHRHTYYCVNAVKWFCQEPLFCGVSVAAGLAICRCVLDTIKPVTPVIWERGERKQLLLVARCFLLAPSPFPLRAVPVL